MLTSKNPLTIRIETYFGTFLVLSTAIFFGTLIYRSASDFDSESIVMESQRATIKGISPSERALVDEWVHKKKIKVPEGKGYRYLVQAYPAKPWTD